MARLRATVAGVFAAALWGTAGAQDIPDSKILQDFDVVAFRNEFVEVIDPRVIKWTDPLRVFIDEDVRLEEAPRGFLEDHMVRLRRLTGIGIEYVDAPSRSNYIIVFTRRSAYEDQVRRHTDQLEGQKQAQLIQRTRRSNCLGLYSVNGDTHAIMRAVVIIQVDHANERALLTRCIVEETTQTMGLPNDDDSVNPSIFNDRSVLKDLSRHDELLLRLLYDTRLTPGMRREEALAVARRILPELRRPAPVSADTTKP